MPSFKSSKNWSHSNSIKKDSTFKRPWKKVIIINSYWTTWMYSMLYIQIFLFVLNIWTLSVQSNYPGLRVTHTKWLRAPWGCQMTISTYILEKIPKRFMKNRSLQMWLWSLMTYQHSGLTELSCQEQVQWSGNFCCWIKRQTRLGVDKVKPKVWFKYSL